MDFKAGADPWRGGGVVSNYPQEKAKSIIFERKVGFQRVDCDFHTQSVMFTCKV
jgi:hypothetical protein